MRTVRLFVVKYVRATRCTSAVVRPLKDVELAVGSLDVVMDDDGVREDACFFLIGFTPEDVVARELVLGALQLPVGDRLGSSAGQTRQ